MAPVIVEGDAEAVKGVNSAAFKEDANLLPHNNLQDNDEHKAALTLSWKTFVQHCFQLIVRRKTVSFFWAEKFQILYTFLQVHALLIVISFPWPWPYQWYDISGWTLWFNLDIVSYSYHRGISLSFYSYWHCLLVLIAPLFAFVMAAVWHHIVRRKGDVLPLRQHEFDAILLRLARFYYFPLVVHLNHAFSCTSSSVLVMDADVQCWHSLSHQVLLLSACLSLLLFGVFLPTTMFLYSRQNIVYGCSRLHERYLCSREMEFVLGINEFYATSHIHLIASFQRPWAYYSTYEIFSTLLQGVNLILLGPNHLDWRFAQSCIFSVLLLAPGLFRIFSPQYRCRSTDQLSFIFEAVMVLTCLMAVSTAAGVKNSLLVASTLSKCLWRSNLVAFVLFFVWCIFIFRCQHCDWPLDDRLVAEVQNKHSNWVSALRKCSRFLLESQTHPTQFLPKTMLVRMVHLLDKYRKEAKKEENLLEWTLYDMTENLSLVAETAKVESIFPNAFLKRSLEGLRSDIEQKTLDRMLMSSVKMSLLKKLLVLRGIIGDDYVCNREIAEFGKQQSWEGSEDENSDSSSYSISVSGSENSHSEMPETLNSADALKQILSMAEAEEYSSISQTDSL